VLVGSLVGQDWSKILVGSIALFGVLLNTMQRGIGSRPDVDRVKDGGSFTTLPKPHPIKPTETTMSYLFNPQDEPKLADQNHRQKFPPNELPEPDDKVTNWK
jgi:hypothetical protein